MLSGSVPLSAKVFPFGGVGFAFCRDVWREEGCDSRRAKVLRSSAATASAFIRAVFSIYCTYWSTAHRSTDNSSSVSSTAHCTVHYHRCCWQCTEVQQYTSQGMQDCARWDAIDSDTVKYETARFSCEVHSP